MHNSVKVEGDVNMIKMTDDPIQWESLVDRQVQLWHKHDEEKLERSGLKISPWDTAHITISRAYGARGYRIGTIIAEKLNWEVYSRQLVEFIADSSNLRHKVVEDFDEKKKMQTLSQTLFDPKAYSSDKHYRHLVQVILSIAEHGRAIIVGRGANFITDRDKGLHVRVTASLNHRIERYANKEKVSFKEAKKKVESMDREKAEYIEHYFKADIADPHNYDLVINVEHLTNEQVADIIISALEVKLGAPRPQRTMADGSIDQE